MVTPELSRGALSACSHPSKPHVYCVGIPSCRLVSLGFLSCLLQKTFQGCRESRLKLPEDEGCAGYSITTRHLFLLRPGQDLCNPIQQLLYSRALGGGDPAQVLRVRQIQALTLGPLRSHKKGLFPVSTCMPGAPLG